jgi:DNA-binding MarR family transcriptional regulator
VPARRSARRTALLADLDREARRTGTVGALHGKAIADAAGIHPTDFECLDVLDWTGPISAGELARRVGLTSGAITGVIDRLARDGWVRRTSDPTDRRRVVVEMLPDPPQGAQLEMVERFGQLAAEVDAINAELTDDELATVLGWLQRANDAVERNTERLRRRP